MNSENLFLNNQLINKAVIQSHEISTRIKDKPISDSFSEDELGKMVSFLNQHNIIKTQINAPNINDDVMGTINTFNSAGVGVITLPGFYLNNLYTDNVLSAIPALNVLNLGTRYIQWLGGEVGGLPDRYHDYNEVPKANVDLSIQQRPVISLQIAIETTIMEEYFNKEIGASNLNVNLSNLKAMAAQRALTNSLNDLFFQGAPSVGIYGLFNDPALLPAVSLKESDWQDTSAPNNSKIINDITKICMTLSNQSGQDHNALNATLILPYKYQGVMLGMVNSNMFVSDFLKKNYPNIKIVFSVQANSQGADNKPVGLLFNNRSSFDGVSQSPFIRPVGLNYISTPISTNKQTLKVTQELYIAQTAGSILMSPYDVVPIKWTS